MITLLLLTTLIVALLLLLYYYYRCKAFREQLQKQQFNNQSIAVKHGKHWEQFAPFMKDFPGNKENFRFIGMPIDGIIFDEDEIKFVEIKTGNGKLSEKQQRVKHLVEQKRVCWKELKF